MQKPLVLASTSAYRRQLLERLDLPHTCISPDIDESPLPQERPGQLSLRLAEAKARAPAAEFPAHLIIGSDQVASLKGELIGKPGNFERASGQLRAASGAEVTFFTSVALYDSENDSSQRHTDITRVIFRELDETQIRNYLLREEPYGCAGSFKVEGLGIALFERIESDDPSALIGLPLIALCTMLRAAGVQVL